MTIIFIALFSMLGAVSAFQLLSTSISHHAPVTTQERGLFLAQSNHFERAIECAEKFGLCNIDELMKLADELETLDGCYFEQEATPLCEKEALDRQDVAEILRLESQLRQAKNYLTKANLFAHDVHEKHNMEDRDHFLNTMNLLGTD